MSAPQGIPSPTKKWHTDTYASISPSNPPLSMKGKKVVISGGGYGIGREVVLAYAEAGASEIAILGRKEGPLNETKQLAKEKFPETQVSVYIADISDPVPVKAAAEQFGTWDILVLNAGYMAKREVIDTADLGDWWNAFEINVKGMFILVQTFLPFKGKDPVIVGTSTAAVHFPEQLMIGHSSYIVSKLAINKLIQLLAVEHPDIHVVSIHPGVIETQMYHKAEVDGLTADTIQLSAHFTLWASSPEARFANGRFLWCNWDVDELKENAQKIRDSGDLFKLTFGGWPYAQL